MPPESIQALADPHAVDVAQIERELEALWRGAGNEDASVLRATAFNLVYVARKSPEHDPAGLLAELSLAHPSRTMLVLLADRKPSATAWVTAYCHKSEGNAQQICSEFITLESDRREHVRTASTLRALLLGGLPTTIIWHSSVTITHPLLRKLADSCTRLVTCAVEEAQPASEMSALFQLWKELPPAVIATDLLWSGLSPWRAAIVHLFDCRGVPAAEIERLVVRYQGAKVPAGALLLAAWITHALRWSSPRVTMKGKLPTLTFGRDHRLLLEGVDMNLGETMPRGAVDCIEFHFRDGRKALVSRETGRIAASLDDNILSTVPYPHSLLHQLQREVEVFSPDPLQKLVYRIAREWQQEILFS